MPLETATYVDQLVPANPSHTDPVNQGDSHIKLIKNTIVTSFPNIGAAVTATAAQLNGLTADVNGRSTLANRLIGDGAVPVGSMHHFPLDPGTTLVARGGTAAGTEQYIECDGSTYPTSKFPYLSASGMVAVAGPNFTVPQLNDTGRFLRARSGAAAAGTSQANQTASHAHTWGGTFATGPENNGHTHSWGGNFNTFGQSNDHTHVYAGFGIGGYLADANSPGTSGSRYTSEGSSNDHTHNINVGGTTGGDDNAHTHNVTVSGTTSAAGAGSETRPEAFVTVCVIKT